MNARKNKKPFSSWQNKVYSITKKIPVGYVTTYGAIAKKLGSPKSQRAVARALHHNPYLVTIPCHRVIYASGRLGGYSEGIKKKLELLESEGVFFSPNSLEIKTLNKILEKL